MLLNILYHRVEKKYHRDEIKYHRVVIGHTTACMSPYNSMSFPKDLRMRQKTLHSALLSSNKHIYSWLCWCRVLSNSTPTLHRRKQQ